MLEKIKKVLNVKGWFQDVLFTKVAGKGVAMATGALLSLIASPKVAPVLAEWLPKLKEFGIDINPQEVATVGVAFVFGALYNWVKRVATKPGVIPSN